VSGSYWNVRPSVGAIGITLNSSGSATAAAGVDAPGPGDALVTAGQAGGELADGERPAPDGTGVTDADGTEGSGETVDPHAVAIAAAATASAAIFAAILKPATGRRRTLAG
jgi:hypothetical protein